MADALKKARVSVEHVVVKNAGHSLGGPPTDPTGEPTPGQSRNMSTAFFDRNLKPWIFDLPPAAGKCSFSAPSHFYRKVKDDFIAREGGPN